MGRIGKNSRGQRGRSQSDRQSKERGRNKRRDDRGAREDARPKFQRTVFESIEAVHRQEDAIAELKSREVLCPICGEKIEDMDSAISDRQSGMPAHFDCVVSSIASSEHIGEGESVAYIGQGRFAVIRYENKDDPKTFRIERKIEWERRGTDIPWRHEMSALFSQVL